MSEDFHKILHDRHQKALVEADSFFDEADDKNTGNNLTESKDVVGKKSEQQGSLPKEVMEKIGQRYNDTMLRMTGDAGNDLFHRKLPFYRLNHGDFLDLLPDSHTAEDIQLLKDEVNKANEEIRIYAESLQAQGKTEAVHDDSTPQEKEGVVDDESVESKEKTETINDDSVVEITTPKVEEIQANKSVSKPLENSVIDNEKEQVEAKKEEEQNKDEQNGASVTPEVSEAEKDLLNALDTARKECADVQHRELKMKQKIRKYFKLNDGGEEDVETQNIITMKDRYRKTLESYKEYKIRELTENSKNEEEFQKKARELFTFFNYDEAIKFYDARTEARINHTEEKMAGEKNWIKKTWHYAQFQSEKMVNFYDKKIPTSAKLALAGVGYLTGSQALSVGRRAWGAFMICTSFGMKLDKLFQFKDRFSNSREIRDLFKELSFEDEKNNNFNGLSSALGEKISTLDNKLKQHVVRSRVNKGIALVSGMLLGSSVAITIADAVENWDYESTHGILGKLLSYKAESGVAPETIKAPEMISEPTASDSKELYEYMQGKASLKNSGTEETAEKFSKHFLDTKVSVDQTESAKAGLVLAPGKTETVSLSDLRGGVEAAEKVAVPVEVPTSLEGERIPIQKGDGIRDTLFKYLEKHHPEVKDREYVVTQMVRDFRHDNPGKNLDLVFNNNSLVINDHNGFHITSIEGNDNWGKGSLDQRTPSLESKNIPSRGIADANISSDIPTNETYKEWNSEIVDAASRADREKYEIASAVAKGEIPAIDPNSPNFQENFNYAKSLQEAAASDVYNWAPSYEVGRLGEAMKNSREHMKLLLEMPDKETFTKIGRDFFDNKKSNILKFGNMNVREALSNPDENLKGLSEKARKLIIGYASSEQTMPKPNENFKLWSYRIMKLARSAENKMAA